MRGWLLIASALAASSACTSISRAVVPAGHRELFVTTGDIGRPYRSLGPIQATRRGALVFGFGDPAGTKLQDGLDDLMREAHIAGADGVINVRYQATHYPTATRVIFAILFFFPLPSEVTVTGELVKLEEAGAP